MFTQSCFIRKNNENLRKKLEELGYTTSSICKSGNIATSSTVGKYSIISDWHWNSTNPHTTWNNGNRIDCGENEELFLAIAALRDDTDRNQWFIYDSMDCKIEELRDSFWFKCEEDKVSDHMFYDAMYLNCKKATVEEIIKHFK